MKGEKGDRGADGDVGDRDSQGDKGDRGVDGSPRSPGDPSPSVESSRFLYHLRLPSLVILTLGARKTPNLLHFNNCESSPLNLLTQCDRLGLQLSRRALTKTIRMHDF